MTDDEIMLLKNKLTDVCKKIRYPFDERIYFEENGLNYRHSLEIYRPYENSWQVSIFHRVLPLEFDACMFMETFAALEGKGIKKTTSDFNGYGNSSEWIGLRSLFSHPSIIDVENLSRELDLFIVRMI